MENRCEEFLNLYRDLEEHLAAKARGSRAGLVQEFAAREGGRYREELDVFREMRNLLSHHGQIDGEYIVEPSVPAVEKMREIVEYAKNPPAAMQAAVPTSEILCADFDDSVAKLAEIMEKRGFSHVPVIDGRGILAGVFSVGTLFTFLRSGTYKDIRQLKIGDLREVIRPERHSTEQFAFVDRNATCYRIKEIFNHEGPSVRRVAAVFVTQNGKQNSPVLGMITPWDIIKYK